MTLHKLIYRTESQSTQSVDEFILMVDLEEYKKWQSGGMLITRETIPHAQVVDSFDVFHVGPGNGKLGKASKQQLENVFGTSKNDDVVAFILENGILQNGTDPSGSGILDKSRFGQRIDTRGSGSSLRGV
ncbi:hypothetical protein BU17DRAFT_94097 [Hysterangium stoloniferum]|nr:hypothetical protein BU17DRAFT_94097 [Hysterangium stoloniferum]